MSRTSIQIKNWLRERIMSHKSQKDSVPEKTLEDVVDVFDIAAAELRRIDAQGGDPMVVAQWASQVLQARGFEPTPFDVDAFHDTLAAIPDFEFEPYAPDAPGIAKKYAQIRDDQRARLRSVTGNQVNETHDEEVTKPH